MSTRAISDLFTEDWLVHGSIYSDPELFVLEQERIFRRCWLYVGHESEVSEPGDYKTTFAGTQPVIVSRDSDDGSLHVLLNRCRHRGATVCQAEAGNAAFFRCPYHGWTYRSSGALRGVPYDSGYTRLARDELGLTELPQVDTHAGFIFACFDPDAPSLADYLGNAAAVLDRVAAIRPGGIRLTASSHKIRYDGNWKLQIENTQDGYHFGFVHRSYMQVLADRTGAPPPLMSKMIADHSVVELGNGHVQGGEAEAEHADEGGLVGGIPFNIVVFPNLAVIGLQVRHILPKSVNHTEVRLYPMMYAEHEEGANAAVLRMHEDFNGPAGPGTTDDMEIAFYRTGDGRAATEDDWIVMSRGIDDEKPGDNGTTIGSPIDELSHRAFYRQWRRLMEDPS